MKRKILLLLVLFFLIIDVAFLVYYFGINKQSSSFQTQVNTVPLNEYLPNVNIAHLKVDEKMLIEQKKIQAHFSIQNKEDFSLSNISLLVEFSKIDFTQEKNSNRELIDTYILPDTVQLKPQETKQLSFIHTLPSLIPSSSYLLSIKALNQTGLSIGGSATLLKQVEGGNRFLEMSWQDAKIIHENQEVGRLTGPIFKKDSSPQITLTVKNPHDFVLSAVPHFSIYARTILADSKPVKEYDEKEVVFEPQSEQKLTFTLPSQETPESYLLHFRFIDSSTKRFVSGIQEFRWVVEGKGGKILSVKIGKAERLFGKTTIEFIGTFIGPPDMSRIEDITVQTKLFSSNKNNLLGINTQVLSLSAQPTKIQFPIQFSSNLLDQEAITVHVNIIDETTDTILDQSKQTINIASDTSREKSLLLKIGTIVGIIVLSIIVIVVMRKKKKKLGNGFMSLFFLFLLIVLLMQIPQSFVLPAQADSQQTTPPVSCSGRNPKTPASACVTFTQPYVTYNSSVNATDFTVPDTLVIQADAQVFACANSTTSYSPSVTLPSMFVKTSETINDKDLLYTADVLNPGSGSVSITQSTSVVNNCFGTCNSSASHTYGMTVKDRYYTCSDPLERTCSQTAPYISDSDCSTAEGETCYLYQSDCQTSDFCKTAPQITIEPGEPTHLECENKACVSVNKLGADQCTIGPPDSCNIVAASTHLACQGCSCVIAEGKGADQCTTNASCCPTTSRQYYPICQSINDAHPYGAVCALSASSSGVSCSALGEVSSATWSSWTPQGTCGTTTESRTCQCSGSCPISGCWNGDTVNPVYDACNTPQSRPVCISQRPNNTPNITSVTQPTAALGSTKHNGGNKIQSLDVAVFWNFQEGQNGCGNPWGFSQTGNPCSNSLQQNSFNVRIFNSSNQQVGSTINIPSTGGNGNRNYSAQTITQSIRTAGTYTAQVCAFNGYAERCSSPAVFTKVKIPAGTITGQLIEHFNYDLGGNNYCAAPGVSSAVQLQLIRQYANTPGLPSSLDCTMLGLVKIDGVSKITSYTCTVDYDNINFDIPTIDSPIDYLNQTFSLQLKGTLPPPYIEYYCPKTANTYCTNATLNSNEKCINNNSIEFVSTGQPPKNEFDQNENPHYSATVPQTINVLFDISNSGTNAGNYYKIKNAQFTSVTGIYSPFPANPLPFKPNDPDDTGGNWLLTGQTGSPLISPFDSSAVTLGSGISNGARQTNALLDISFKKWENNNYTSTFIFTPSLFIEYSQSRKPFKPITQISQIETGKINIYDNTGTPNITIDDSTINNDFILVVKNGNLTITPNGSGQFNSAGRSIILMSTNTLQFDPTVSEAIGVFFTNNVDLGSTTNLPLKIKGNLIASTVSGNHIDSTHPLTRQRTDNQRPALFVVFDAKPYMDLLPLLSTATYKWSELVP